MDKSQSAIARATARTLLNSIGPASGNRVMEEGFKDSSGELPSKLSTAFEHATNEYIADQELKLTDPRLI